MSPTSYQAALPRNRQLGSYRRELAASTMRFCIQYSYITYRINDIFCPSKPLTSGRNAPRSPGGKLMLRILDCRRIPGFVLVAGLGLSLAGPALAAELYRWTTDDGTVAFTDDVKHIPERYRKVAKKISTGSLRDYTRYTPDRSLTRNSEVALAERVDRLRAANAALETHLASSPQPVQTVSPRDNPFVRVGPQADPSLEVSASHES